MGIAANEANFLLLMLQNGAISFCEERVKRFVNAHLYCIVSNLKSISKMSTLPLWKNYCECP